MLSKVRHYVPQSELKSIYYAIFSSHMVYGCQVWGQKNQLINRKLDTISRLQNRALRIINFKNIHDDPSPLYKSNRILKIKDFITLQNTLLVHDYLKDNLPDSFQNFFRKRDQIHPDSKTKMAKCGCLFVPSCNSTTYRLNSITHHCIDDWNTMTLLLNDPTKEPEKHLIDCSRFTLKSKVTEHFINQC